MTTARLRQCSETHHLNSPSVYYHSSPITPSRKHWYELAQRSHHGTSCLWKSSAVLCIPIFSKTWIKRPPQASAGFVSHHLWSTSWAIAIELATAPIWWRLWTNAAPPPGIVPSRRYTAKPLVLSMSLKCCAISHNTDAPARRWMPSLLAAITRQLKRPFAHTLVARSRTRQFPDWLLDKIYQWLSCLGGIVLQSGFQAAKLHPQRSFWQAWSRHNPCLRRQHSARKVAVCRNVHVVVSESCIGRFPAPCRRPGLTPLKPRSFDHDCEFNATQISWRLMTLQLPLANSACTDVDAYIYLGRASSEPHSYVLTWLSVTIYINTKNYWK